MDERTLCPVLETVLLKSFNFVSLNFSKHVAIRMT